MLKALFRSFLALYIFLYQRTQGQIGGQVQGLPVLLLTTTGRRTGKQRITPLGYFQHAGDYVVTASNAGFDTHPAWYHNLISNPQVSVQIKGKTFAAQAQPAEAALRQQLWAQLVALAPGYGRYEKRTTREIPLVLLRPIP